MLTCLSSDFTALLLLLAKHPCQIADGSLFYGAIFLLLETTEDAISFLVTVGDIDALTVKFFEEDVYLLFLSFSER